MMNMETEKEQIAGMRAIVEQAIAHLRKYGKSNRNNTLGEQSFEAALHWSYKSIAPALEKKDEEENKSSEEEPGQIA